MKKRCSRREAIKLAGFGLGSLSLGGHGSLFSPKAFGQGTGKQDNHLVCIQLHGGYSASFSCAQPFLNHTFGGITDNNMMSLGNGLFMHNSFNRLPASVLQNNVATVGLQHGQSSHPGARSELFMVNNDLSVLHHIASGMGGPGSIKFAFTDGAGSTVPKSGSLNGTSMQKVTDMDGLVDALGGATPSPYSPPDRSLTTSALIAAQKLSRPQLEQHQQLITVNNGFSGGIEALKQPVQSFDINSLLSAYSLTSRVVGKESLASQLACAELLMLSGTNVTLCRQGDWDTHGDPDQSKAFRKMRSEIIPALSTFVTRVFGDSSNNIAPLPAFEGKNVTIVIMGDFCRTGPKSQHGTGLAATVISKNVKTGSTATVNRSGVIGPNTHNVGAFWAFLATTVNAPQNTIDEVVGLGGDGTQLGLNEHMLALGRA